jgi:hypothetical protein
MFIHEPCASRRFGILFAPLYFRGNLHRESLGPLRLSRFDKSETTGRGFTNKTKNAINGCGFMIEKYLIPKSLSPEP